MLKFFIVVIIEYFVNLCVPSRTHRHSPSFSCMMIMIFIIIIIIIIIIDHMYGDVSAKGVSWFMRCHHQYSLV